MKRKEEEEEGELKWKKKKKTRKEKKEKDNKDSLKANISNRVESMAMKKDGRRGFGNMVG